MSRNLAATAQCTSRGAELFRSLNPAAEYATGLCVGWQGALISAHKTNGWTLLMYSYMKGDAHSARLVRVRRQSTPAALTMLLPSYLYSRRTAVRCVHHIDWVGGAVLDARSCSDMVRISATETATVRPPCI